MKNKNVAVILSGGLGSRAGFSQPKQLVKLAGSPVLAHTIRAFQDHPLIEEICIVSSAAHVEEVERLASSLAANKVHKVLVGGRERRDSSLAAIKAYEAEDAVRSVNLIFHDAVRPLVGADIIDRVVAALQRYKAVDVAIRSPDTIITVDSVTGEITAIPERSSMRLGQTPQAFALATISAAYKAAAREPTIRHTDDCGVVHEFLPNEKIIVVEGDLYNHKLTHPEDLLILDRLIHSGGGRRLSAPKASLRLPELRGRSIAIFGGTSGIGEQMVELARRYGAVVKVASRRSGVDVADAASVTAFLQETASQAGRIDAVVNAAATLHYQPLEGATERDVLEAVGTNYTGAINVARLSFRHLKASRGHLLFFASSSYTFGRAHYALYSSSKAAVVNLSQALADEWEAAGVRVNCVNPERTATPMRTRAFGNEAPEQLLKAETVALEALAILAEDVTGRVFDIARR